MQCVNFIHPIIFNFKVKEDVEDDTLELCLTVYFQKNFYIVSRTQKRPKCFFHPQTKPNEYPRSQRIQPSQPRGRKSLWRWPCPRLWFDGVGSCFIATWAPKKVAEEGKWDPLVQGNLGWWNIVIWPDCRKSIFFRFVLIGWFLRILPMGCITIVHHHHLGEYVWVTFSKRFKKIPSWASILSYLNSLVLVCPLIGIDKSFWIVKGTIMNDSTNHYFLNSAFFVLLLAIA